jgi:hypothetical protein
MEPPECEPRRRIARQRTEPLSLLERCKSGKLESVSEVLAGATDLNACAHSKRVRSVTVAIVNALASSERGTRPPPLLSFGSISGDRAVPN